MNLCLLNKYEEVTYTALQRVCESNGARVFPKVRVGDVFALEGSGVSAAMFSYALRAHFDFLVTDSDYQPLFSVEFDGPLHKTSAVQRERDRLKEELCDRFYHGLLRVNSLYLTKQYRGLDLLTYFVEAWFLEQAFSDAQRSGQVPYDEPFDMTSIYSNGSESGVKWPYWLSLDIQHSFKELHKVGKTGQMVPSHYVGIDPLGNYRCLSWLVVDAARVLQVKTGMRAQRFPAVSESELLSMLAMFDLYEGFQRTQVHSRANIVDRRLFFETVLPTFEANYKLVSAGTCGATV
jgi:hypothetical protein